MGMYVAVRGWLELSDKQRAAVESVLQRHDDALYSGSWTFPARSGWSLYLFHGADIRESALPWLRSQLAARA